MPCIRRCADRQDRHRRRGRHRRRAAPALDRRGREALQRVRQGLSLEIRRLPWDRRPGRRLRQCTARWDLAPRTLPAQRLCPHAPRPAEAARGPSPGILARLRSLQPHRRRLRQLLRGSPAGRHPLRHAPERQRQRRAPLRHRPARRSEGRTRRVHEDPLTTTPERDARCPSRTRNSTTTARPSRRSSRSPSRGHTPAPQSSGPWRQDRRPVLQRLGAEHARQARHPPAIRQADPRQRDLLFRPVEDRPGRRRSGRHGRRPRTTPTRGSRSTKTASPSPDTLRRAPRACASLGSLSPGCT